MNFQINFQTNFIIYKKNKTLVKRKHKRQLFCCSEDHKFSAIVLRKISTGLLIRRGLGRFTTWRHSFAAAFVARPAVRHGVIAAGNTGKSEFSKKKKTQADFPFHF